MSIIMEEFHIDAELLSSLHEASDEDLQALAELHEDPAHDDQIELYIYLCFLIFRKSHNTQSLEQAIQRAEGWAAATAASHPDHNRRHSIMDTLVAWGHQYRTIEEDVRDELGPLDSRTESATNEVAILAQLFRDIERFQKSPEQTCRPESLNEAIEKLELAMGIAGELAPTGIPHFLGILLGIRFTQTGSTDDLNRAISILSEVVDATSHDEPRRASRLDSLRRVIQYLFDQTGSVDDLDRLISVSREVVDATPHNDPERASRLDRLGDQFLTRFEQKRSIEDLNQAISIRSEAVDSLPHNHQDYAKYSHNLAICFLERFHWMESGDDLDRAVDLASEAVNTTPHDHPNRVHFLCTCAAALGGRFKRAESIDDLYQAISIVSEAVDSMAHDDLYRANNLVNLGNDLRLRFGQTGSIDDLDQAINILNEALDVLPYNHPRRAVTLESLGVCLDVRSQQTGSIDDRNQAISLLNEAIDITPLDNPGRPSIISLAAFVQLPSDKVQSKDDLDRLIPMFISGWRSEIEAPRLRIFPALMAARLMMKRGDWEQSYQLLREAISLLHTLSSRSSNRTDAQTMLTIPDALASLAVAAALNAGKAPEDALRILEHGRGVIASLMMDMRGDITDLRRQYPDLAERFSLLRNELDLPDRSAISPNSTNNFVSQELQISRYRDANREFKEVIDKIRAQPGFSSFLQPPGVKELMEAAERGPIIILNMTEFRSDAFLIQPDSIQVIKLPNLREAELQDISTGLLADSELSPLLEWLWHTICHPCLDALGIKDAVTDDNWPHIWWIPTGVLSQLPLHAAGIYKPGSRETALDRAVSSYASSIKALLHGRKHGIQMPRQPPSEDSALIVSMQETPGLGEGGRLPFAADEVHMLKDLCPQLQLASVTPSRNKEDVLKHMPKCKVFHFAGHGQSDPRDPSRSCLLLEDWKTNPLTVGDIRDSRLQDDPPFLAYLSACSTGANKVEQLAEEGIHLISAFQLAGFRHAIGTLWEVSDKHCVDVARILYKTLQEEGMTDLAVSRGLHRAVRALRDGNAGDVLTRDAKLVRPRPASQGVKDFFWVPYVHFGV